MSDRHIHITSFLAEDEDRVDRFIAAARETGFFRHVAPVRFAADGPVRAVAFYSKDLDGVSDSLEMPQIARMLTGILEYDIVIVTAYDGDTHRSDGDRQPERVWKIPGLDCSSADTTVFDTPN
jgi:hypothetical protein